MSQVDERIERLIVRRLDGELSDEEALELDRELLRSPQVRQLFEEYQRIDRAAGGALTAAVGDDASRPTPLPVAATPLRRKRYSRFWWVLPAAVAAGLALVIALLPAQPGALDLVQRPSQPAAAAPEPRHRQTLPFEGRSGIQQAAHGAGSLDRAVDQDSLYIIADDGNIYVIDRQHVRTARRPNVDAAVRQASGDL